MVTARCNLACGYCVLEDSPEALRRELDLAGKMDLIAHLYHRLGFRRLTLSGGEALIIGKRPPSDFRELIRFLRGFRSRDPRRHLEVELYTNGAFLDDAIADELAGVVDLVAVTIDSKSEDLLLQLGRSTERRPGYYGQAVEVCRRLTERGIEVKLHSVVGTVNHERIGEEVRAIYDAIQARGGRVSRWKFYQYMSYDDPRKDGKNAIGEDQFARATERIERELRGLGVPLHFKGTGEMHESLFNILQYGNAQYMREGDTWSTSRRTGDLREYASMQELFARHDISEQAFRRYHEIQPRKATG
jgi:molybdenum cofactor biosynthesis enzyme MoaA